MKIVPIITWIPCRPVEAQKALPYTPSLIEKAASEYSKYCNEVKITANTTVKNVPIRAPLLSPAIKAWCPYVTKAPEDNNNKVFNNGIEKGSNGVIPIGGQLPPISIVGAKLEWKNAQNTLKKAKTSVSKKKANPIIKPLLTSFVWHPKSVLSIITSLNQRVIPEAVKMKPKLNTKPPLLNPCKYITAPIVSDNNEKLTKIGHGEGSTK